MSGVSCWRGEAPAFAVTRRRRAFGLDAPRPPDLGRTEAAILAWLAARIPQVSWLRAAEAHDDAEPRRSSTLVLLMPGGRIALMRIEVRTGRRAADTVALARQCRSRRIPFQVVSDIDEARAMLRRLGVEAEEV